MHWAALKGIFHVDTSAQLMQSGHSLQRVQRVRHARVQQVMALRIQTTLFNMLQPVAAPID